MLVAIAALLAGCLPLKATVLFSTFGAGGSHDTSGNYAIDGNQLFDGVLFNPSFTAQLGFISVAISHDANPYGTTLFQLHDGTSTTHGNIIETWTVANNSSSSTVVHLLSVIHPILQTGGNYWLFMSEADAADGSNSHWHFNDLGLGGTRRNSFQLLPNSVMPAFSVNSTTEDLPVPEPSTALLGVLGLMILAVLRGSHPSVCRIKSK